MVAAFEALGCQVHRISDADGFPDLVIHTPRDGYILVEVKDGNEGFTPRQRAWHANWRGPSYLVRKLSDVETLFTYVTGQRIRRTA